MKVISAPDVKSWSTQVTCSCTAVLEINVEDISSRYSEGDRYCLSAYTHYVNCSICNNSIPVLESTMNAAVKFHLERNATKPSYNYWDR